MERHNRMGMALAIAMLATSCAREDALTADPDATVGSESSSGSEPNPTTLTTTTDDPKPDETTGDAGVGTESGDDAPETRGDAESTGSVETTADPDGSTDTDSGDSGGGSTVGVLPFTESFEGLDGAPWPMPWEIVGTGVTSATIQDGRGRLEGATANVARMVLPGFDEADIDATITVTFDDWTQQGFGLYVRQNGGVLQETDPPGQGYCVYVEGGYMQSIGVWRELDGVEELLHGAEVPGGALQPGVAYQVRLHCRQEGTHTRLRARMWPLGEEEPAEWQVDMLDDTPVLQGVSGSVAVDVYNYSGVGGVVVDDLHLAEMPDE